LWTLAPADDGRTQVCNVEAFAGPPIVLIKPFLHPGGDDTSKQPSMA
jgi:hypothetical protein